MLSKKMLSKKTYKNKSYNKKTYKNKSYNKKTRLNVIKNNYNQLGAGLFNNITSSIGSSIYHKPKEKDYSVHIPGSQYAKLLNPERIKKLTILKPQSLLSVIFNYHKPNQLNLINVSKNVVLPSGKVEYEPHITVNNMKRYLVIMYDTVTKKMHYVIEFKNRSKYKTILSYLPPRPEDGKEHKFVIQLINYPQNLNPLKIIDMSSPKRRKMFRKVFKYIKNNNLLPAVITKSFNVKLDLSSGINLFNIINK